MTHDDLSVTEQVIKEVMSTKNNMVEVFKQAPAFMCVLRGPNHEFELVNERYLQLIGYREVVGLTVRQALPEIEGQGFFELLDSVYQSGETFTGTDMPVLLQRSPDKPMERRFIDLVYTALKDADGVINGILVHGIDQTERKQSEMALAEREEQLRLALEAADVGLWDVDVEKDTLFWPPRVKAMFGISADVEVSMQDFYDGLHPEDLEHTSISYANATDPNLRTQYDAEYRTIGKEDGVIRWVAAKGRGIFNETNQCIRVIGTAIDITQRKAAEEALRKSEEQLRESDRKKDEFLAMLAHELRNPLSPISSAIEIMALSQFDVERVKKYSHVIERQVKHMAALINDLLDVSRVKRGLVEIKKTPQNLVNILQHSIEQVKPVMDGKFQRLDTHYESTSLHVLGDEKRLIQIMTNVLNNAAKYTQEHGNIDLCVREKGGVVIVEVIDNGIGISKEDQAMVFELFSQARRDSDRSQGGLGIGLAIVKGLLDLHNGSITCFSEGLGKGSKFTITLPVVKDCQTPSKINEIIEPEYVSNQIIVVVDDNIDAATSLADILRLFNHLVHVEHVPSKALDMIFTTKPTVCILDIGLPGIDGYEMARQIRKQPDFDRTLLIAVTGYGQEKDKEEAFKAGFDLHFVKPVDYNLLCKAIEDMTEN